VCARMSSFCWVVLSCCAPFVSSITTAIPAGLEVRVRLHTSRNDDAVRNWDGTDGPSPSPAILKMGNTYSFLVREQTSLADQKNRSISWPSHVPGMSAEAEFTCILRTPRVVNPVINVLFLDSEGKEHMIHESAPKQYPFLAAAVVASNPSCDDWKRFSSPVIMKKHNVIVDDHIQGVPRAKTSVALVMAGGAGSGKGSVIKWLEKNELIHKNFAKLDVDEFRTYLDPWKDALGKQGGIGTCKDINVIDKAVLATQSEAGFLNELAATQCAARHIHFIYDGTLRDKDRFEAFFHRIRSFAKDVKIIIVFVDTPEDECQENAKERAKKEHRSVPPEFVASSNKEARHTVDDLQGHYMVNLLVRIENCDRNPRLKDSSQDEDLRNMVGPKAWQPEDERGWQGPPPREAAQGPGGAASAPAQQSM